MSTIQEDEAADFWRNQFPDVSENYPPLPFEQYVARPKHKEVLDFEFSRGRGTTTLAIIVRAAWALVTSSYTGSDHSSFGLTLSGRDAAMIRITEMLAPTITTVPLRVEMDSTKLVGQHLQELQDRVSLIRKYQHFGLHRIRRLNSEAASATTFRNSLVTQNVGDSEISSIFDSIGVHAIEQPEEGFLDIPLTAEVVIRPRGTQVCLTFDNNMISNLQARCLLHHSGPPQVVFCITQRKKL